jgi:hypothetical protein
MGTGELKWNIWSHLIMAVLIIVLGVVLGDIFGELGVVLAYVLSIIIGSLILIWFFYMDNIKNLESNYNNESKNIFISNAKLFGGSIAVVIGGLVYPVNPEETISFSVIFQLTLPLLLMIILMWNNEMRLKIFQSK